MSPILQNSPQNLSLCLILPINAKKVPKSTSKQLQFGSKVFLLPIALPQGLLKEVPIYFKIFTIKVVGQTIQACSTTKKSEFQSNGIIKLGLVKCLGLYCNLSPNKSQKSKQKLVAGFQINFLCIDPDQGNHLKDLRGGIQKIWEFHLPYWDSPSGTKSPSPLLWHKIIFKQTHPMNSSTGVAFILKPLAKDFKGTFKTGTKSPSPFSNVPFPI